MSGGVECDEIHAPIGRKLWRDLCGELVACEIDAEVIQKRSVNFNAILLTTRVYRYQHAMPIDGASTLNLTRRPPS